MESYNSAPETYYEQPAPAPQEPTAQNIPSFDTPYYAPRPERRAAKPKNGLVFTILGLASGALSLIFGLITMFKDVGSYERSLSYGGDAYTGIQNAAAQSANNVLYVGEMLRFGLGALLIVFGLAVIAHFGAKLGKKHL